MDKIKYWRIRSTNVLLFLLGFLGYGIGVILSNQFDNTYLPRAFGVTGFILIIAGIVFLLITNKSARTYIKGTYSSTKPKPDYNIDLGNGRWIKYVIGFIYVVTEFVLMNSGNTIRFTITLILYLIFVSCSLFIAKKDVTKRENILLLSSIPIYILIKLVTNIRITNIFVNVWLITTVILLVIEFIKIYKKEKREHNSRLIPIIAGIILYLVISTDNVVIFNSVLIPAFIGIIIVLLFIVSLFLINKNKDRYNDTESIFLTFATIPIILTVIASFIFIQFNYCLDEGTQYSDEFYISDKDSYEYDNRDFNILVYEAFEDGRIQISEEEFNQTNVGDSFEIYYYTGFFGMKYYLIDENEYITDRN